MSNLLKYDIILPCYSASNGAEENEDVSPKSIELCGVLAHVSPGVLLLASCAIPPPTSHSCVEMRRCQIC